MLWARLIKVKPWDYLEVEGCIVTPLGKLEVCASQTEEVEPF
jgi:hypothetical protein